MITKNPSNMPLESVLPVIVSVLPLRYDTLENRPCYNAIFTIFRLRPELLSTHMDRLLAAFAHVLLDPSHEDETVEETKAEMKALVEHLKTQIPEQVKAAGFE
jgi:hypothetical protein